MLACILAYFVPFSMVQTLQLAAFFKLLDARNNSALALPEDDVPDYDKAGFAFSVLHAFHTF